MIATRTGPERSAAPPGPPQPVFCDESGMTGNDLLDPQQAFFTYAGVAVFGMPRRQEIPGVGDPAPQDTFRELREAQNPANSISVAQ